MKVLTVGGGAREHAIVKALMKEDVELYCVMSNKNPGMARAAKERLKARETDVEAIISWIKGKGIDLAVVGPEAPLGAGLVNALEGEGIACVGPTKQAARIETDKEFMRGLLEEYDIPGRIGFRACGEPDEVKAFLDEHGDDVVVKPIGLTGGKGAKIFGEHLFTRDDVLAYADEIFSKGIGGTPRLVVEERARGEEFTLQCFCDGTTALPMPMVQDHKRAYEGDTGPNTGGMGSYSMADHLLPFVNEEEKQAALDIVRKTIAALRAEGSPYHGILYGQFMLTADGPKVIEFNARFGDPEAMNVLSVLETPFTEVSKGIAFGKLKDLELRFKPLATVCKYVVPEGYGVASLSGQEITVDEKAIKGTGAELYYASVDERGGKVYTTTSRSLGVVGIHEDIVQAEKIAELALSHVQGRIFMRHDIGKEASIARKVRHMDEIRARAR